MLEDVLEANQETLQRLPIEARPPTEKPFPHNTGAAQAHQQQHFSPLLISAQDKGKAVVFLTPSSFQL